MDPANCQDSVRLSAHAWHQSHGAKNSLDALTKEWSRNQVLRMSWPRVENVWTSSDIILDTSRGLQLTYRQTQTHTHTHTKHSKPPVFTDILKTKNVDSSSNLCLGSIAAVTTLCRCIVKSMSTGSSLNKRDAASTLASSSSQGRE